MVCSHRVSAFDGLAEETDDSIRRLFVNVAEKLRGTWWVFTQQVLVHRHLLLEVVELVRERGYFHEGVLLAEAGPWSPPLGLAENLDTESNHTVVSRRATYRLKVLVAPYDPIPCILLTPFSARS